ncbi:C-terminal processing protease CtpA/Prc [Salegentibacter sp. 24]|uniref:S41 family peptidase n=1 Tax=Salegentibacter sp. 24 TaxID=2183986 RepID=UPI00105B456C|nr:S41 family peptidase [Salegentibacter sp. 24]TDN86346.1 C-terminal processing protease CtpA/Prc [Salegentibacter sp. 24]
MKINKLFAILALSAFCLTSCEKDDEALNDTVSETEKNSKTEQASEYEVEQFIHKGMNELYLYKSEVPELADSYFVKDSERNEFLASFGSPKKLFDAILFSQDRFSFITDDYISLEERFEGISSSTAGMKYGLGQISGTDNIFGFLQYIIPGTSAHESGLTRGTVFTEVDGVKLTMDNFSALLDKNSLSINLGEIQNGAIVMSDKTITLHHSQYTANPVHIAKTLNVEGQKVGYLMYNSFVADFDDELNAAFGQFKAEGVTALILDLRYNGGGSVESAVDLASMITGQFEGEVFMKEHWNKNYQDHFEKNNPERLVNRFNPEIRTTEAINSLHLSRVYVLTSGKTASASKLVINGLEPYINVIQIGETTTGKFQASVTLYDSPDFSRNGANENHKYAIQPLVFKSSNVEGKSDYVNGLPPDVVYAENLNELGVLGETSEPLLKAALNHLLGKAQETKTASDKRTSEKFKTIGESGMNSPIYQKMFTDKLPPALPE